LKWSERQALAKKQAEEEPRSRSASYFPPGSAPVVPNTFTSSAPTFGRAMVTNTAPRNFSAVGAVATGVAGALLFTVREVEVEPIALVCITANALFMQ
jgi:hypothetical protein